MSLPVQVAVMKGFDYGAAATVAAASTTTTTTTATSSSSSSSTGDCHSKED